jgi:heme oxygenase
MSMNEPLDGSVEFSLQVGIACPAGLDCDILTRLKRETRDSHERVETMMGYPAGLRSIENYVRLLQAFHALTAPVETMLLRHRASLPASLMLRERLKAPLIKNDLEALSSTPRHILIPSLAELDSTAQLMGALYVLEGATLGGQVIRRLMLQQHGAAAREWLTFFNSYGKQTGYRWAAFRRSLADFHAASPTLSEDIMAGAHTTFAIFSELLRPDAAHRDNAA